MTDEFTTGVPLVPDWHLTNSAKIKSLCSRISPAKSDRAMESNSSLLSYM